MIDRRTWNVALFGALALPDATRAAAANSAVRRNVLRVPMVAGETGFDPPQVGDLYSRMVTAHIFEALYHYDLLAMPVKVRPLTAVALPEVSEDFRVWTVRIAPGIFFADDPVFGGRPRELVAEDYVYAFKRYYDPALKSPGYPSLVDEGIEGLQALRDAALLGRTGLDYDVPVAGLRALDRHTLQFRLREPRPRFVYTLANSAGFGAVAREVVEHYRGEIMAHPVGTGPYRLAEWQRNSRIVLARNPGFREMRYDAEPNADDAQGLAWLARFKGRRLPLNDGVEISVLEESQPRWLAFLSGQLDLVRVPGEFGDIAMPNGRLAPNLAKRGVEVRRYVNADSALSLFNMDDPLVGGYAPAQVALRRAIELAYDMDAEIRIARRGQAVPAQAPMPPGTYGYDPAFRTENSMFDRARAQGLLDLYGYRDRDGDGWRERPDGAPLVLHMAAQSSAAERQFNEIWQKSLAAVGLRVVFDIAQWAENYKAVRAGKLQMWYLGSTAGDPDAQPALELMYGPAVGGANLARFRLPAFDAIYRRIRALPDGPERAALFLQASKLVTAYMPYRIHVHRIYTDLTQPWITGWREALFRRESWQFVEVDGALRERLTGG